MKGAIRYLQQLFLSSITFDNATGMLTEENALFESRDKQVDAQLAFLLFVDCWLIRHIYLWQ